MKEKIKGILSYKNLILIIILLGFIVIKLQDLFLPYFWDEAWSYIPAIKEMTRQGPSLAPNSISPDLYRGHPLLFYFLTSVWFRLFGDEIWVTRLFPLLISIALLISVHVFVKKAFDYTTAILTTLLLTIQSVFIAQATFLLPEVMLTLFTVLTLLSYLQSKKLLTIFWLTLALFTKESAIIIWFTVSFFELINILKTKNVNLLYKLQPLFYLAIPILLISLFFIAQKFMVGWFFFPEHISYISFDSFLDRFNGYSSYLFVFMGRNLLTFFGLIALIWLLIGKDKTLNQKKDIMYILLFFIIAYLLFSSANFYSPRYLLSILPFVIIILIYLIRSALSKYHFSLAVLVFTIIIINNINFTIKKLDGNDHTLGYRDLIKVQFEMVNYCEENNFYEKEIATHFLMQKNLTDKSLGYLKHDRSFDYIQSSIVPTTELIIFSSNELDKNLYYMVRNNEGSLLKRIEQNNCWVELYMLRKQ